MSGDADGLRLGVGGLSRPELLAALDAAGVARNAHAETLLAHPVFERRPVEPIVIAVRSVAELGRPAGATLPELLSAAAELGLGPCPADTAPYLRLALSDQTASSDPRMSTGRAPADSLTVASDPLSTDDEDPKGFYLRVVDGVSWLRGYRCDDEHVFAGEDRFAFQRPERAEERIGASSRIRADRRSGPRAPRRDERASG
ncbi:hypothetical protein [Homoserinibacter sp. YIM 151385]|uniref:hypothetical protein n=1 Tax=Homoserinibacter sp. YIM 151385 TaxID=2985506 RepID=UPI0022F10970|nr:hypothetical protein [Homoserinibacter sp. YIM 151385]WBU37232.1 hypothetical protein OF852_09915 [Homoserinibacter sp. YIM 151385]